MLQYILALYNKFNSVVIGLNESITQNTYIHIRKITIIRRKYK